MFIFEIFENCPKYIDFRAVLLYNKLVFYALKVFVKGVLYVSKKSKKRRKQNVVFAVIGCLAVIAVVSVSVAVYTAVSEKNAVPTGNEDDSGVSEPTSDVQPAAEEELSIPLDDLQPEVEEIIADVKDIVGGEWSVYITIPKTGDTLSINQMQMQAASVIKLCIMCAVYEDYENIISEYSDYYDIDSLIENMIVISSNEDADLLVNLLGRGDNVEGRQRVNEFCEKNGLSNTSMDRMMGDDNIYSDNYTTTEDMAKLLQMIYEGKFEHSKDMLHFLGAQDRTHKIPAGVPSNVRTANKTGELDDVQNDAAIIYTKYPYIIVVMSDGIVDYQIPIDAIVDISETSYNYISEKEYKIEVYDYYSEKEYKIEVYDYDSEKD